MFFRLSYVYIFFSFQFVRSPVIILLLLFTTCVRVLFSYYYFVVVVVVVDVVVVVVVVLMLLLLLLLLLFNQFSRLNGTQSQRSYQKCRREVRKRFALRTQSE